MTTGVGCATRGCGGVAPQQGAKCTNCNIDAIRNPAWRAVRHAVHRAVSGKDLTSDASGIVVWHSAGAEDGVLALVCNDAAADASSAEPGETAPGAPGDSELASASHTYPAVTLPGGDTPQWWQEAAPEQKEAWGRLDTELAAELNLERPYTRGPNVGSCPGSGSYGHGLTMRSTHFGCCDRWDATREQALADGRGVPTDADRQAVNEREARWKADAERRAHEAGALVPQTAADSRDIEAGS